MGGATFGAYNEKWPQRDELCAKVMPIPGGGFVESRIKYKVFLYLCSAGSNIIGITK